MLKKLFGETDEEQFKYLKPRVSALGVGIFLMLIGVLLTFWEISFGEQFGSLGGGICVIVVMMFGWSIMRGLFGFASLGALFAGNVVIGVVIFVAFLMIGYLGGFVVAFIGICRFFVLLKKRKGNS